jgi:exopolysaccharide biosynthesis WecB/TagA/CpsF family protein
MASDPLTLRLDGYDLPAFVHRAAGFGVNGLAYVVTPNVDHVVRLKDDPQFRESYAAASFVLLDSRVLASLLRLTGQGRLPVCTGSDLTAELFRHVIRPDDPIVLVGGRPEQAAALAARYGLRNLRHHDPPMGFINDPAATTACLEFLEAQSPFRFGFLAVGSPQQEFVARALKARGQARGLVLCVGAALDFLTGEARRAPAWMQRLSLEWLHRLLQNPGRLAHRYLVRGPRILAITRSLRIERRQVSG